MVSTIAVVALSLGTVSLAVVLWGVFLRLGLRWAKVASVTTGRIAFATGTVFVIQATLRFVLRLPSRAPESLLFALVELSVTVFVPCFVIMWMFKTRFFRSVQASLPPLASTIAMILFMMLVWQPFLYETFVTPTNAMAPTLRGPHHRGICPECGRPGFCSVPNPLLTLPEPPRMICENFHLTQDSHVGGPVIRPDRFVVAKFFKPRRWDLVVFQFPEEPSTLYVKRLVGLPGETILIEDGSVWANGKRLTPPDSLDGITYLSKHPEPPHPDSQSDVWGSKNRPAVLSDDEYFVLGDFSAQSYDSRFWEYRESDHNPFAVPESHLQGVVTHIYWPPTRWRVLR